jgi:predicted DNA-binding transcriptional regulator YafY
LWYLVAAVEEEIRSYRVSRVQEALLTDQPCIRPQPFDLAAYWEQSSARFLDTLPRYPATVRVAPAVLLRLRLARYIRIEHADAPDEEGWSKLVVQFETEDDACEYILRFGPQIEVLEPQALRERVIRHAESIVSFYAQRSHALVAHQSDPP